MSKLESIAVGGVEFGTDEELFQFRFRLLHVSLLLGVVFSGALVLADWWGLNEQGRIHFAVLEAFFLVNLILAILLWGRKDRFAAVAWSFFVVWFLVDMSALCFIPKNELRPIWFFVQVGVVYAILGTSAGLFTAVLALVTIVGANRYLPVPFSSNAMVTLVFSLCAVTVFLHVYTKRLIAYHQHVTEANAVLREMSSRDPLTGIHNARAFYETSDYLIRQAQRAGAPFSVLFVDLDHFKSINDRYGHEAGDAVLKEVADCLAKYTRGSDALGRIGGDEFLILLPHTDLSGAKLLADKLRQNVETLMPSIGSSRIRVTVSIGVARNQADRESMAKIKQHADQAMYQAKAAGRNCVMTLEDLQAA
jgi:diguanylate cyclase (GGDEF)-like protein